MDDLQRPPNDGSSPPAPWLALSDPARIERGTLACLALKTDPVKVIGAYLADLSTLSESLITRFLAPPDTAALAILCRSLGFSRGAFEALTLSCAPTLGSVSVTLAGALFDALSRERANRIVAYWRISEPHHGEAACFAIPQRHRDA